MAGAHRGPLNIICVNLPSLLKTLISILLHIFFAKPFIPVKSIIIQRSPPMTHESCPAGITGVSPGQPSTLVPSFILVLRQVNDSRMRARTLHRIGWIHEEKGEYDKATELLNQSVEIFTRLGDREWIAANLGSISMIHGQKGEYEEALSYVLRSYEILEMLRSPRLQIAVGTLDIIKAKLGKEEYERLVEKVKSKDLS